jgi:hypothetical protein
VLTEPHLGLSQDLFDESLSSKRDVAVQESLELTRGVTRDELNTLKRTAVAVISESVLKKLLEIDQVCSRHSLYLFMT